MKNIRTRALVLMLLVVLLLGSCEFLDSRIRKLPPVIQIFNSRLERTLKMMANDTLYVKVSGLKSLGRYVIQVVDYNNDVVTELVTDADDTGTIEPVPLWYDVGFKKDPVTGRPVLDDPADLALRTFQIRVASEEDNRAFGKSLDTDFMLDFFFVNNTTLERPQPIVLAGTYQSSIFNVENSFKGPNTTGGPDSLYVKAFNMTDAPVQNNDTTARVYVMPFSGVPFVDGASVEAETWFYRDVPLSTLISGSGALINWDDPATTTDENSSTIPSYAEGKAFSVLLDVNNNGKYDVLKEGTTGYYLDAIDGNGVAGFIVQAPPPPSQPANYVPLNLASGGMFRYEYVSGRYVYNYDYRDLFNKNGSGTNYASHSGEFWGYGVKVIWNPYSTRTNWPGANGSTYPSNFWGQTVDVYIVPHSQSLIVDAPITPVTGTTVKRVPVQSGCSNGWYQQTIWRADYYGPTYMTPGQYMIVVDMDRNGKITDNDLVDNLWQDGTQHAVTGGYAGFTVLN